ncbi:MAG: hypothetical protein H6719_29675 [Sandaracinaceae bacterium]|nr:hypothetical protein [Sandaracinaceae bacterium]
MSDSPTAIESFADSTIEIDHGGDFIVDTSAALAGDVYVRLSPGRAFNVVVDGATVFQVTSDGSNVRIDLGGGAGERLVLGDALKSLLNEFWQMKYDVHTHPTAMGPSGPPLPLFTGTQMGDDQLSDVARTKRR